MVLSLTKLLLSIGSACQKVVGFKAISHALPFQTSLEGYSQRSIYGTLWTSLSLHLTLQWPWRLRGLFISMYEMIQKYYLGIQDQP